jgi:hypothetical protein
MDEVIVGIEAGDAACVEIGVEFIEEWARRPFGAFCNRRQLEPCGVRN